MDCSWFQNTILTLCNIINMTSGTLIEGCWILALPLKLYNVAFIITIHPCNFME